MNDGRPLRIRRLLAAGMTLTVVAALTIVARAQVSPAPSPTPAPLASGATVIPSPLPSAGPTESPAAGIDTPTPIPTPTQPPITVDPSSPGVEPNRTVLVRVNGALGSIAATVADPTIATVTADQGQRALYITGRAIGSTTITVHDDRGISHDIPVRVAFAAGSLADSISLRVTGDPASATFVRDAVLQAASAAATLRAGARVTTALESVIVRGDLRQDDRIGIDVPLQLSGEGYFNVNGVTHVDVENFAMPRTRPARLLVSDYPERLTENGVLFTAQIDRTSSQRFLYYHYNPGGSPERRILAKITNPSNAPALLHVITSLAGPGVNEMEVGHNATKAFLLRERRNEGTVITVPPMSTINLVNHALPPGAIVNALLQVRETDGEPLKLALVAQDANAPLDQSVDTTNLLAGGAPHARGAYSVPEFFSDYTFFTDSEPLEIPIGQLPLPNLREGETLAGDYGVKQAMRVVIINTSKYGQAVALYANPRGGAATGTFLIDNTLVQAHRLTAFSKFKLWQETIAPNTYRTLQVVTMPEGGSSYPLRLIFAADDGSPAPGAPGSPVY